ncbi:helix-turn-helix transcriptional regulator [Nocardioides litoris]|uniref:helix-turn-helix transcriptional regulator n=1 Tax=Nocardioides litoris TaxID=1926648 RepID=UPI00111FABBB|nr:helix-turn-helix transcriptional regulator [Nocardioides litoris]
MDKQELGAFLRSRRERLAPEDVGLPSGPRRRTSGLRREEVAVLAHVSTEYYTRLEQARASRPSAEVCAALAGALRLDEGEAGHLFVLAGTADERRRLHRRDVRPSIAALVHRLPDTAAFVLSAAYEVLVWNDLAGLLMEDFATLAPEQRNLARRAFLAPPCRTSLYGITEEAAFRIAVTAQLRATRARYPDDPDVAGLVDDLRAGSPDFARLWERHDVAPPPMLTKTFDHPAVGRLTLDCDSVVLPERDQHLVLYTAPAGSAAADGLALLGLLGSTTSG